MTSGLYHVALCGQAAYTEQLMPAPKPRSRPETTFNRTVIFTGGTKGLGFENARRQLQNGASTAVLLSRHAVLSKERLVDLTKGGKAVFTISCDASSGMSLAAVASWAREWLPAVQVCPHCFLQQSKDFGQALFLICSPDAAGAEISFCIANNYRRLTTC